jgi:hypothetical protein
LGFLENYYIKENKIEIELNKKESKKIEIELNKKEDKKVVNYSFLSNSKILGKLILENIYLIRELTSNAFF